MNLFHFYSEKDRFFCYLKKRKKKKEGKGREEGRKRKKNKEKHFQISKQ